VKQDPPHKIRAEMKSLETEILQGIEELEGMIK
jgi:hypothetical protein